MNVSEVMTKDPVTIGADASLKDVARLFDQHRISGLPVVGHEHEVLGVVSEADIIVREAGAEEAKTGWSGLLARFGGGARPIARTAGEAMSSPAVTIRPEARVAEAARMMLDGDIKRLPVVDADGRLVGIVTRADLVRAFTRTDEEIRREIEQDVLVRTLWVSPGRVAVSVRQGEVSLTGRLDTELNAELLPRLVERVPGVVSVTSSLSSDAEVEA